MTKLVLLATASCLAFGSAANAVVFVGATQGPDTFSPGSLTLDFNSAVRTGATSTGLPSGYAVTGSNFDYYTGTTPGISAAPLGDATRYLTVRGGGSATITFPSPPAPVGALSFYAGSIDTYNNVTFSFTTDKGNVTTFTGAQLANPANGDQTSPLTNARLFFRASPGDAISQVTLTSGGNSFEIDSFAVGGVPEASTWAMLVVGIGMVGGAYRRRCALRIAAA